MTRIILLGELYKKYKKWTLNITMKTLSIKNNILQNSEYSPIEQKVASTIFSSLLVSLGTGIAGIIGVSTGGLGAGVALFGIGWILSKGINKKIFGTPRSEKNLKDDEMLLFLLLDATVERHVKKRDDLNNNKANIFFTDYVALKRELEYTLEVLKKYDIKHLSFVYRAKHPLLVQSYKVLIEDFKKIYARY